MFLSPIPPLENPCNPISYDLGLTEEYKKKQADIGPQEDAVQMRQRLADQDKNRRLKEMDALDRKQKETQGIGEKERHIREKHRLADEEKQKKLEGFKEMGKVMSQVYHAGEW